MSNKIKITVGGITYSIAGEESEEYLNALAGALENKLKNITRQNPRISTTMAAVTAALDAMDETVKARKENERLKAKIEKLEAKIGYADQQQMRFQDK